MTGRESKKFQVGDKIKVLTDRFNTCEDGPNQGDIIDVVTLCKSFTKGVWIDRWSVEVQTLNSHCNQSSFAGYFELCVETKKRFKPGDKVISIKNTPEVPEGTIGYIFAYSAPPFDYAVDIGGKHEYFNKDELGLLSVEDMNVKSDAVNKPKHYAVFEQLEAIEVIASSMTTEQFYGYCLGNILKYRLRAGGKDDVMQELGKADRYQGLFTEFKHLCKDVA